MDYDGRLIMHIAWLLEVQVDNLLRFEELTEISEL